MINIEEQLALVAPYPTGDPDLVSEAQRIDRLRSLLEQAWREGWDERERRGPLAGAFDCGPEFNPYRVGPPPATWFNTQAVLTVDDLARSTEDMRTGKIPRLVDVPYDEHVPPAPEDDYRQHRCGICMKSYDDCDCAQAGRR